MRSRFMTMLFLGLACVIIASSAQAQPAQKSKAQREKEIAECLRHLRVISRALKAYRRDHKTWPANLSDLYPKYVSNKGVFHCPADESPGKNICGCHPADPNLPVSYDYQMNLAIPTGTHVGALWDLGCSLPLKPTWRDINLAQKVHYGDLLSIVFCHHHWESNIRGIAYPVLYLMLGGQVYRRTGLPTFEADANEVVVNRMVADMKAGPSVFLRRWNIHYVERYFDTIVVYQGVIPPIPIPVRRRIASAASRIVALSHTFPNSQRNNIERIAARIYIVSGNTTTPAIKFVQRAFKDPEITTVMLTTLYQFAGDKAKTLAILDRQMGTPGSHLFTILKRAKLLEADKQPEKAVDFLHDRLSQEPQQMVIPKAQYPYVPDAIRDLIHFARLANGQLKGGIAKVLYQCALAIMETSTPNPLTDPAVNSELSGFAQDGEDYATARKLAERINDIGRLIWVSYYQGDLAAAKRYAEQCNNRVMLGFVALALNDYKTAKDLLLQELADREHNMGKDGYWLTTPLNALGDIYLEEGDLTTAKQIYQRCIALSEKADAKLDLPVWLRRLGGVEYKRGDLAGAKDAYLQALAMHDKLDPNVRNAAVTHGRLARVLDESGAPQEAIAHLRQALHILDGLAAGRVSPDPAMPIYLRLLARLLIEEGNSTEAQNCLERTIQIEETIKKMMPASESQGRAGVIRPEVRFLAPPDNREVTGDEVEVQVVFLAPIPLACYRVWINGRPFGGDKGFELPLPDAKGRLLEKGEDREQLAKELPPEVAELVKKPQYAYFQQLRLTLPIEDTDGPFIRIAIQVDTTGGSVSDRQILRLKNPNAEQNRGALRVLSIGIGHYQNLPQLRFAAADALEMGEAFKGQAGEGKLYRGADITILTDAEATLARIREALGQFTTNVRPGDTLILALSGHGLKQGDAFYFAPVRLDPENLEGTGLPWNEVLAKLQEARKRARAVWVLADACRAAPGLRREQVATDRE